MKRVKYSDNQFRKAVKESLSISEVCRKLGLVPKGGNFATIKNKSKKLNLSLNHFTGKGWNVGQRYRPVKSALPLEQILKINSPFRTSHLKMRLLREGIKQAQCENCKRQKWLNKPIPLELHHLNGISTDNRLENLQLLCPNCHSFTDTYRGRNQKI